MQTNVIVCCPAIENNVFMKLYCMCGKDLSRVDDNNMKDIGNTNECGKQNSEHTTNINQQTRTKILFLTINTYESGEVSKVQLDNIYHLSYFSIL